MLNDLPTLHVVLRTFYDDRIQAGYAGSVKATPQLHLRVTVRTVHGHWWRRRDTQGICAELQWGINVVPAMFQHTSDEAQVHPTSLVYARKCRWVVARQHESFMTSRLKFSFERPRQDEYPPCWLLT